MSEAAKGHIIIVDDEQIVLDVMSMALMRMGFETTLCSSGSEAVQLYAEQMDRIDLIIVDMSMPEMSGPETISKLKEINPSVRILLSSGSGHEACIEACQQNVVQDYISKPVSLNQLRELVSKYIRD